MSNRTPGGILSWSFCLRILIADNNVELCQVLQQFFALPDDLEVVGEAHDGEQALREIQRLEPDMVLL